MVLGQARRVGRLMAIPERTISEWVAKDWWEALVAAIRHAKAAELDGALTGLIHQAVDAAADRIVNGEWKQVGAGLRRMPVSARDAMQVAAVAFDQRQATRSLSLSAAQTAQDLLVALAEQLEALSGRASLAGRQGPQRTEVERQAPECAHRR